MGTTRGRIREVPGWAFIAMAVLVPSAALTHGLHGGGDGTLTGLVAVSGLISYTLVLGAGVLAFFHWRTTVAHGAGRIEERLAQWLPVALTAGATSGLMQLESSRTGGPSRFLVAQLAVVLGLCLCTALAERVDVPGRPAVACAAVALVVPAVYAAADRVAPPGPPGPASRALLTGCVLLASLLLAWLLLSRRQVSPWVRRRLAVAAVLMNAAQCLQSSAPHATALIAVVVGGTVLSATVLAATAHDLLRRSLSESRAQAQVLEQSLTAAHAAISRERELLHEVGAILAGISTASQVMREQPMLPTARRARLESMLTAELARLERLMDQHVRGASADPDRRMRLDEVVEPVVTSHQARGRDVSWEPTGLEAVGNPDELAEICNVLLENAARHAPGAPVTLSLAHPRDGAAGGVEVVCSDLGPGVAAAVRERIFAPGAKAERSSGQGLGLAIAHRLATARGGDLQLVDTGTGGATFQAVLPAKEGSDERVGHLA